LLWQLDQKLKNFIDTTDLLYSIYNAYIEDDSVRLQIENRYNKLILNHSNYLKTFIADNPTSLTTLIAFYQVYNKRKFFDETENLDLLKKIYNQLQVYYPTNENVIFLKKRIELITSKINDENITKK
jgi:esterase/lipase superfamily enzyme